MEQFLNKEQVLQEIEGITRTIDTLIWIESSTAEYQNLLSNLISAKNDLQMHVLHNMDFEPAPKTILEDKIKQLYEYLDTGSYTDVTYLIVRLLELIVEDIKGG